MAHGIACKRCGHEESYHDLRPDNWKIKKRGYSRTLFECIFGNKSRRMKPCYFQSEDKRLSRILADRDPIGIKIKVEESW